MQRRKELWLHRNKLTLLLGVLLLLMLGALIAVLLRPSQSTTDSYDSESEIEYRRQQEVIWELTSENEALHELFQERTSELNQIANESLTADECVALAKEELNARELPHPSMRVGVEDLLLNKEYVLLNVEGVQAGILTDTDSMDPLLDEGNIVLEVVPISPKQIHIGDLIIFESSLIEGRVIHRVIAVGVDSEGWYAITKGDNLLDKDPEKVRFEQVRGLVIGIIY